jgi:hypothetical protein
MSQSPTSKATKKILRAIESGSVSEVLGALDGAAIASRPPSAANHGRVEGIDTKDAAPKAVAKDDKPWNMFFIALALVTLAALVALIYGVVILFDRTITADTLRIPAVKISVSVTVLAGAILLYMVKVSAAQFVYGLAEIAVGLVANWRSLESLARQLASPGNEDPLFARFAVIAGGMYLIGRGVANFVEGVKKNKAKKDARLSEVPEIMPNPSSEPEENRASAVPAG